MDPELIAYLDQRFNSIDRRFEQVEEANRQTRGLIEETNRQTRGLIEETNRQTRVLIEGVWDDVRQVAEGQAGLSQRVEALEKMAEKAFDTVKEWVEPYYRNLDGRIRDLSDRVLVLEGSGGAPAGGRPRRRSQAAG